VGSGLLNHSRGHGLRAVTRIRSYHNSRSLEPVACCRQMLWVGARRAPADSRYPHHRHGRSFRQHAAHEKGNRTVERSGV
jgi:hypothetical protein